MSKRLLGQSGISVTPIGLGTMTLGIAGPDRISSDEARALLRHAIDDCGVELIDTADSYCHDDEDTGYLERIIGMATRGTEVIVATKGGYRRPNGAWVRDASPRHLREAAERSLRALGSDALALYQLHAPDPEVPFAESVGALEQLRNEGKIIHIGLCNVNAEQLAIGCSEAPITTIQNPLSPMTNGATRESMIRECDERGITWLAYAPLGGYRNADQVRECSPWIEARFQGRIASVQAAFLAWSLAQSPRIIPIPGTSSPAHLQENMGAAKIELTRSEVDELAEPKTWFEMYSEAVESGETSEAVRLLACGLSFHPTDAELWYRYAAANVANGANDEAVTALEHAIAHEYEDVANVTGDPEFASLRALPIFERIAHRIPAVS